MADPRRTPSPAPDELEPAHELSLRVGLQRRDRAALEAVFRLYWPRLLAHARVILPHDLDPDDAAAEVMLHVVRWAGSFDTRQAIYPWLARICLRVCARRRAWFDRAAALERIYADTRGRAVAAEADEPIAERDGTVARALARLPTRIREAVGLRYLFGLEPSVIAQLMNLSARSVSQTLWRGMHALRTGPDAGALREWLDTWGEPT
jgi:RNA polymerase sigma-70 factor (ECF subfamily)